VSRPRVLTGKQIPDGLIIPSASIAPPFSYSGNVANSPKKGEVATQKDKNAGVLNDPLLDKGSSALLASAATPSLPAVLNEAVDHIFSSSNKVSQGRTSTKTGNPERGRICWV
jgi:hypothetical protein